jgi:hypothetical protein
MASKIRWVMAAYRAERELARGRQAMRQGATRNRPAPPAYPDAPGKDLPIRLRPQRPALRYPSHRHTYTAIGLAVVTMSKLITMS